MHTAEEILTLLCELIGEWHPRDKGEIDPERSPLHLGLDSLAMLSILGDLESALGIRLEETLLFDCDSIREVAALLARRVAGVRSTSESAPATASQVLPLSRGQRALWASEKLNPTDGALNVAFAVRVESALDVAAWERACGGLVARHAALRTRIEIRDGEPVQVVQDEARVRLGVVSTDGMDDAAERERVAEDAWAPFDLGQAPLFRATVYVRPGQAPIALLAFHHLVVDFWSLVILLRELLELYASEVTGRPALLPNAAAAVDLAASEAALEGTDRGRQLAAFWRERLADLPALSLPRDKARTARTSARGVAVPVKLDAESSRALRAFAADERTTPSAVLLAAYAAALHRFTLDEDVVVGTPLAGRSRADRARAVGYFVNPAPMRISFAGDRPSRDVVAAARAELLGAFAHQDYSTVPAAECANPAPAAAASAAPYRAFFVLQQPHLAHARWMAPLMIEGGGPVEVGAAASGATTAMTLSHYSFGPARAQFDLTLSMVETEEGFAGVMLGREDVLEEATVRSLARTVERVVSAMVRDPGCAVSQIAILDPGERERLLAEAASTAAPYPHLVTLQSLVEARVRTAPEKVALSGPGVTMTYDEMWRGACALASRLAAHGVGRGDRVGVCLDRAPAMVVAMLGVLAAGAAYVPMDPSYPEERLALIQEDAGVAAIIATEPRDAFNGVTWMPVSAPQGDSAVPVLRGGGEDTAYIMYTSGSTGAPKGVEISHRAITRLTVETNYVELGPDDRIAQASNASFDAATFEIWGALLAGATLVFIPRDTLLSPARLARFLRDEKITTLFLTTSLFNAVAAAEPSAFDTLGYLLVGGEALGVQAARGVLAAGGPKKLINAYGPTETTTFAAYEEVTTVRDDAVSIPIGRPIGNTTLYVLDPSGEPTPVGAKGELFIGGPGVAKGYWQRPTLTSERFVPSRFGEPGAAPERLYRTGDIVRRLGDGRIDFLGRRDAQVKLRGFRIEVGEVEACLARGPGVRGAAVLMQEDARGEPQLVAYVVLETGRTGEESAPEVASVREALRASLPEFMRPQFVVPVAALPLTPHGKLDRAALTRIAVPRSRPHVPITDETEALVAAIWEEVLAVTPIGRHDDFFDLGGNSLLASQVISRLDRAFGVELPVRALFESPTVEKVARELQAELARGAGRKLAPIRRLGRSGGPPPEAAPVSVGAKGDPS